MKLGSLVSLLLAAPSAAFQFAALRAPAAARVARPVVACDAEVATEETPKFIMFSDAALAQLESMREGQEGGKLILRMGVRAGGCSGMSYVMDLTKKEDVDDNDTIVELD